jgi:site-specific DNA-methyltransferase (cytosine-N4-specific)
MPESVTDRPTKAHEYLFLLTKAERYYYDADAVAEPAAEPGRDRWDRIGGSSGATVRHSVGGMMGASATRNKRSVWTVNTQPYAGAHFATMPEALVTPCILAGSRGRDLVLDPFSGSGTVLDVAQRHGRRAIGCDLNPAYHVLAQARTAQRGLRF